MRHTTFASILATAAMLFAMPTASSAQTTPSPGQTSVAEPLGPPNTRAGYYIENGETHYVWILSRPAEENARSFILPPQPGYPETVVLTADRVSEWGYRGEGVGYIGARIDTPEGPEWYFMEPMPVKPADGSQVAYISDKVLETGSFFHVVEGEATAIGTEKNAAPLLDYFSSATGYRSPDPALKYPGRVRHFYTGRYYSAFADSNDKLIPQRRFGVMMGGGVSMPMLRRVINTIAGDIVPETNVGVAFSAGALLRFPIEGGPLSFQPEIGFSHSSATFGVENRLISFGKNGKISFNSLNAALLFRYNGIRSSSKWMPYVELGPMFAYGSGNYNYNKVGYEVDLTNGAVEFFEGERVKFDLSSYYLGFAVGAGAEYYINARQSAWFGVRYSRLSNWIFFKPPRCNIHRIELTAAFSLFNF